MNILKRSFPVEENDYQVREDLILSLPEEIIKIIIDLCPIETIGVLSTCTKYLYNIININELVYEYFMINNYQFPVDYFYGYLVPDRFKLNSGEYTITFSSLRSRYYLTTIDDKLIYHIYIFNITGDGTFLNRHYNLTNINNVYTYFRDNVDSVKKWSIYLSH